MYDNSSGSKVPSVLGKPLGGGDAGGDGGVIVKWSFRSFNGISHLREFSSVQMLLKHRFLLAYTTLSLTCEYRYGISYSAMCLLEGSCYPGFSLETMNETLAYQQWRGVQHLWQCGNQQPCLALCLWTVWAVHT